ncbi:hypothetical protein ES703_07607 [subsurface metagenome]
MPKKVWSFELAGGHHTVELNHGYWSGKREITVDGILVERSAKLEDTGSVHDFEVSGVPCVLHIKANWLWLGLRFDYKLYIRGELV